MLELICLACGRTNPSDAKFCSQCGTALLRKFCEQCRAVNDAAAHFCHACGAALAEQPLPATLTSTPDEQRNEARAREPSAPPIPTLNEVLAVDKAETAEGALGRPPVHASVPGRDAPASADGGTQATRPPHRTALLAVGTLLVLLVMAALWSRVPRTDVRPRDAHTDSTRGAASADVAAPSPAPSLRTEPASTTTTDGSAALDANAPGTSRGPNAGESGLEALPAPFDKPSPAPSRRNTAGPNPPSRGTAAPAPAPAPPPALQCTPQADALGLCAPGATITGR